MNLLTTNFLVWLLIATALGFTGYAVATGTNKRVYMKVGIGTAILTILIGALCVYVVRTDEKDIRSSLRRLAAAARENDREKFLSYVEPNAETVINTVNMYFSKVTIESVKISNFKILEVNRLTSPPRARISFRGSASGFSSPPWDSGKFLVLVDFNSVEMRLNGDGKWLVADDINFNVSRGF
ncbi:MAG: hypothetical protein ACOX0A_00050 [Thermoguttaceae bacterium]|jgi:uncharacterized membrane protein YtjA (UPF0391 family)